VGIFEACFVDGVVGEVFGEIVQLPAGVSFRADLDIELREYVHDQRVY
jgi:hypothetical protein